MNKTFKVIETLVYKHVVEVKAENKKEAWIKAFENGEMSINGKCVDLFQQNVEIQEQD
tara:strand:- start:162 stop:335 length:174 start_codon:yes stop_codon:yes gene_type:complete